MTEREAINRGRGEPPCPNPNCPKCKGSGAVYDPPLDVQEREEREGKRLWKRRRPCDCYEE